MMRLGRRARLLVAFSLLTSAATAYAECAWVLWEHLYVKGEYDQMTPLSAFTSREDCHRVLSSDVMKKNQDARRQDGFTPRVTCLPDTVDPRGPKGE
jgi:hypothetical protein